MKALYRIVAALAALIAIPVLYFLDAIRILVNLGFTEGLYEDKFSFEEIITLLRDMNFSLSSINFDPTSQLSQVLLPLKTPAIVTLVFFALMLLLVLAVFVSSAFTNSKLANMIIGGLGIAATAGTMISFSHMTDLVISGTVPLSSIANALLGDIGGTIAGIASMLNLGNAVDVIGELWVLQLDSAFIAVMFIFIFEVLWALSFKLVMLEPYKAPKANNKKAAKKHK